jgi:hypothetical protein
LSFRPLIPLTMMLALTSTAFADGLTAAERAALAAQPTTDIASLRAGASDVVPPVSAVERTELARAAAAAKDLDALRAGEEGNHDLEIAGAVLGIIVLAVLIF